ncbi:aminomethyl-transferring glycine dehydrogenase subunit GcvPA [Lignipirellula cremea]|uniref:Probable glycine dehydrogenase (decarboxylating) subunit 1 n=1 Tax=Lignipirellula cremea TaxID=2528010 RepID=A0A518DZM8_9BACT|nr:aminomethyl-transferring glycine dehydrogenase subunit GcvPA [Lignipirellula cremea]QDU97296.1 putative glycine dehydrogenase (decarboxylating) subunit 1 [Lignipirellula cremea]
MPYLFNTPEDQQAMLEAIGASSVEDLFASIPEEFRLRRALNLPPAMPELALTQHLSALADKNIAAGRVPCFLGGGSYDHFIPAAVDMLASRGEFYTSYTPYQPEVSQGNLQAMFEYQSLICQLTGMDVSNASLYDGGSAVVEAVLMCAAVNARRRKVVTASSVHPEYRQILETYFATLELELVTVPAENGVVSLEALSAAVDDQTVCVVVQHPNFFGSLEDVAGIVELARQAGAFVVQSFDPLSLGLIKNPGELGVDVAVAEGQVLGTPMAYGGPYLGIMTCRDKFLRQIPGRIAGQTTAGGGRRCWVLTLQTREQHIRREKATSNICTNQGLYALRASIYLALMGPQGMREAAELCIRKSHYAAERLVRSSRFEQPFTSPFFKEFVVRDTQGEVAELLAGAESEGILAGVPLGKWYPEYEDCLLVAVTEKRTRAEIDRWASCLESVESGACSTADAV